MMFRNRLYLDKDRARLAGVCAGVADYLGWDVTAVRVIWIVATLFWAPVTIVSYILAAWLLEPKPGSRFTRNRMEDVRGTAEPITPRYRFADARARFEQLEHRLRDLETVVTSREYQMDRELRGASRP